MIDMVEIPAGPVKHGWGRGRSLASYWIAATPVTQAQWSKVWGWSRSRFAGEERPVERVSWFDAVRFCNSLSDLEGLPRSYRLVADEVSWDEDAAGYRLPTEVEWEFACRAGQGGAWCFGDQVEELDDYAWVGQETEGETHPVGLKKANEWGLFDMHGNVWEWVWDWYADDPEAPADASAGSKAGKYRVQRGGCYWAAAERSQSGFRFGAIPKVRDDDLGFRVARNRS